MSTAVGSRIRRLKGALKTDESSHLTREAGVIRIVGIWLVLLTSPVMAQTYPPPYDFNAQRRDIQNLRDDLAKRMRETPYWDYSAQQKLREQEYRLQDMERRNREAETDWLFGGR